MLGLPVIGLPGKKPANLTPSQRPVEDKSIKKKETTGTQVIVEELIDRWDRKAENDMKMTINSNLLEE